MPVERDADEDVAREEEAEDLEEGEDPAADILFLKHASSIFRQTSNPVGDKASSPWAIQHRA